MNYLFQNLYFSGDMLVVFFRQFRFFYYFDGDSLTRRDMQP